MNGRERRIRLQLVAAGARLAARELVLPGEGNLSARIDERRFVVTPSGCDKGRMRPADLVVCEIDSEAVPAGASMEVGLHRELFRRFPEVGGVVHAHPVSVQALAARRRTPDLEVLLEGIEVLGRVSWVEALAPGSDELAAAVCRATGTSACSVLHRHGAVTSGAGLEVAVRRMFILERIARLTLATPEA